MRIPAGPRGRLQVKTYADKSPVTMLQSCAGGTGGMRNPSRSRAAVALLVALLALCSVEHTGKSRAFPHAKKHAEDHQSRHWTGGLHMHASHYLPRIRHHHVLPQLAAWTGAAVGNLA